MELKNVTLSDGEMKFRANDAWALSWGGELITSLHRMVQTSL